MLSLLQLWGLLGTCTLIVEVVRLHRKGSSLRALCYAHYRLALQGGELAAIHRFFSSRWRVALLTIGIFPLVWAIHIRELFR